MKSTCGVHKPETSKVPAILSPAKAMGKASPEEWASE